MCSLHKGRGRAQVSLEAIAAAFGVLTLFGLVLIYTGFQTKSINDLDETLGKFSGCREIRNMLSAISNKGRRTEINFVTNDSFFAEHAGFVNFYRSDESLTDSMSCLHLANLDTNYTFSDENLMIENISGQVKVRVA